MNSSILRNKIINNSDAINNTFKNPFNNIKYIDIKQHHLIYTDLTILRLL